MGMQNASNDISTERMLVKALKRTLEARKAQADACARGGNNSKDGYTAPQPYAKVIPNPAVNAASVIYYTDGNTDNRVEVYDNLGRQIEAAASSMPAGNIGIDLSDVSAGIYSVRFISDGNVLLTTKLVVIK